jgi:glycosyltransferase involved in cell wall biosynthesis
MKVEVYAIARNEEKMMPYFIRHYSQFAKIVIIENNSTDNTVAIAQSMGARVWKCDIPDERSNMWFLSVKNNFWKASKADWVIVCDADEFVWHPDIINILSNTNATIIQPTFFEMLSEKFPTIENQIYDEVKTGVIGMSKMNIFRPSEIKEINYGAGCHEAWPTGNINIEFNSGIMTLHMRFLSLQYTLQRKKEAEKRLCMEDKELGLGSHFLWSVEKTIKYFYDNLSQSTQVVP